MKKFAVVALSAFITLPAFADDLVGTWQTYEDGKPKAVVKISQTGGAYTGIIVAGNTEKAKQYVGQTVIVNLKADGDGKYSGGKITDPVTQKTYSLSATQNGDTLSLRGYIGAKMLGRTQTWQKK